MSIQCLGEKFCGLSEKGVWISFAEQRAYGLASLNTERFRPKIRRNDRAGAGMTS